MTYTYADGAAVEPALAALAETFTVSDGVSTPVERTWLDTFDWRLYRSGWTLEQTIGPATSELRLIGGDGATIARQVGRIDPPARIEQVPAGPVRDRIAAPMRMRALLAVARSSGHGHTIAVLDAEQKTVVRLVADHARQLEPVARPLPVRLAVRPLRGYESAGRRVARIIESAVGGVPETRPALEIALAGTGRAPGDYTGKVDVRLAADQPAAAGIAAILRHLFDTFEVNLEGTLDDVDTEFLHDLRVAVRRTRSALKLTGDALPDLPVDKYVAEFKWLGDLTTPARDLDVYLLHLPAMKEALTVAEPADLDPFGVQLERRRATEFRKLKRGLGTVRLARLRENWRADLTAIGEPADGQPLGALAGQRLGWAYRRLAKRGAAITDTSPASDLHRLRKRGKELRYLLEFFAALYDSAKAGPLVRDLKGLQDCLGEFQDCEVQTGALRGFAEDLAADGKAPAATLLAMGELTEQLRRRQDAARREFGARFARFARPKNVRRMAALTAGAST